MPPATSRRRRSGQLYVHTRRRGRVYGVRLRVGEERVYVLLGGEKEGWSEESARRAMHRMVALEAVGSLELPSRRQSKRPRAELPPDASMAYAEVRRASQRMDRLTASPHDLVRWAARDALTALSQAEDAIVRAIRRSP